MVIEGRPPAEASAQALKAKASEAFPSFRRHYGARRVEENQLLIIQFQIEDTSGKFITFTFWK